MMYQPQIETLPRKQLRNIQSEYLKDMVSRLFQRVPFYQEKFAQTGLKPSDIKSIQDISKLPFTKKEDLRDQYPFGLLAEPIQKVLRIHASSGTTGKPTVVAYNRHDLDIFDQVVARSLVAAGAQPGMKLHNAYGYGLFTGGLGLHGGATRLGMAVIPVSGGMTERQIMLIQDFQPEVISCTPSYAMTLAETFNKRGISPEELSLQYAVLGAEPWTDTVREHVEKGLGVSATNIYGLSEIIGPGVSQEDHEEKGSGSYIWEDHFFPEVVDKDTGEPLPYGEEGVLVFTTLTKRALPLLRYWTNDICSIYYDTDGKRTHIKMSNIRGRADDMLIIRGVNLFHTQVEAVLEDIDEISPNYQLIVYKKNQMDAIDVKVEWEKLFFDQLSFSSPQRQEEINEEISQKIQKKIKDNIGLSMQVSIENIGSLPRSEGGKLKKIIDHR